MSKQPLRDYVYLDGARISQLYEQIAPTRRRWTNILERVKMTAGFFSTEMSIRTIEDKTSLYSAIGRIETYLKRNDQLYLSRLSKIPSYCEKSVGKRYFRETAVATRMIVPSSVVKQISGLKALAVWVSDPDPTHLGCERNYEFHGSFLYLVECYSDNSAFQTTRSGCSALKAVVNIMTGSELISVDVGEKFGRGSYDHPVAKLERIGFERSLSQEIETLYSVRYMTDEQRFQVGSNEYRTCDILSYPLYIARSSRPVNLRQSALTSSPESQFLLSS